MITVDLPLLYSTIITTRKGWSSYFGASVSRLSSCMLGITSCRRDMYCLFRCTHRVD